MGKEDKKDFGHEKSYFVKNRIDLKKKQKKRTYTPELKSTQLTFCSTTYSLSLINVLSSKR